MNKVLSITIKNSNKNGSSSTSEKVVTNELTELNTYLDDGWVIIDTKIITLDTGGLFFTVLYHLSK
jgi:hypothetical protein